MSEILELVKPYQFFMPEEQAEKLAALKDRVNTSDNPGLSQQSFMKAVVNVAEDILKDQGPSLKKPIEIVAGTKYRKPLNCTDSAAAILYVCTMTETPAYALLEGTHASVVAPNTGTGYWDLDWFWLLGLRKAMLVPGDGEERESAMNDAAANMGNHSGAMIWKSLDDGYESWHNAHFDGEDLRQETRDIQKRNIMDGPAGVLVNTPQAFSMLRALDVLHTYRNVHSEANPFLDYIFCKAELKHLVPVLR